MKYFFIDSGLFYYKEVLNTLSWLPTIWHPEQGFGASALVRLWYDYPVQLFIKFFATIGFPWWVTDKLLWSLPILISIISSWKLARHLSLSKILSVITSIIYMTNTYFLLLFGGGQLGVVLGYSLAPYVLLRFIDLIDSKIVSASFKIYELKQGLQAGLWLALLIAFDLRLAYLIIGSAMLYYLLNATRTVECSKVLIQIVSVFVIPGIIAALLHMFWMLPIVMGGEGISGLEGEYTGPGMLKFLSVADLSHALSLLHPNWPENLFGKVYFLQPEFLVLPILAFSSLHFINHKISNNKLLFFSLLTLIGSFFAKGVNAPFGGIYQWLFTNIPGFIMFRDPTKFYLFIAIGYSVLIPFVLERINKKVLLFVFIIYWIFTIRAVFMGQVSGNFHPQTLTAEYIQLKNELVSDQVPSRTLWIPRADEFAFSSEIHPVLTSDELFHNASVSAMVNFVNTAEFEKTIRENGVGYVVVPEDTEKNIFLTDYKFNNMLRENLIHALDTSSLRSVSVYKDLKIYKSNHEAMKITRPQNIERQQYLANIGTVISGVSLAIISLVLLLKQL
jgi:hypothetical protein